MGVHHIPGCRDIIRAAVVLSFYKSRHYHTSSSLGHSHPKPTQIYKLFPQTKNFALILTFGRICDSQGIIIAGPAYSDPWYSPAKVVIGPIDMKAKDPPAALNQPPSIFQCVVFGIESEGKASYAVAMKKLEKELGLKIDARAIAGLPHFQLARS